MATSKPLTLFAGGRSGKGAKVLLRGIVCSTLAVGVGDTVCQRLEAGEEATSQEGTQAWWDRERTLRMCTATALVMSPTSFLIVMRLERLFPGNTTAAVLKKTVANGLMAAPMISLNFATISILEGNSTSTSGNDLTNGVSAMEKFESRVGTKLLPTMLNGVLYWPFVNFFSFKCIALENRPVFGALAGVLWSIYMSSVINAKDLSLPQQTQALSEPALAAGGVMIEQVEDDGGGPAETNKTKARVSFWATWAPPRFM